MDIKQITLRAQATYIRWQLRRLEAQRRRSNAEFMLAVDYGRRGLQELHFSRTQYLVHRRTEMESQLAQILKGIK